MKDKQRFWNFIVRNKEIALLNVDTEIVHEIARDLCVFFHQESVMITQGEIEAYYISENI